MAAAWATPLLAASNRYFSRPGLQLFTVMSLLDEDFEGTLDRVSGIGYRTMETVGVFDRDPAQVRDALAERQMVTVSQHLMPGDLYQSFSAYNRGLISWPDIVRKFTDAFAFDRVEAFVVEAIERAQGMGQRYIVWQLNWLESYGLDEVNKHVAAFNLAGDLCHQAGLTFAIHNHNHEFLPLDGSTAYDRMVQETDPDKVKLEMDFMWASFAGVDPVAYFERYPGRYRMAHLKDHTSDGRIAIPGKGVEDFQRLLSASEKAGIEYAFVEFDQPVNPVKEIAEAYSYLTQVKRA